MKRLINLTLFLICAGCSPSSLEDYQKEGEALSRKLIQHLEKIETHEELLRAEPVLKKDFEAYATLIIQAKEYQQKHCDELISDLTVDYALSEQLKEQLRRVYAIEGGREIVEKAQQEALVRLDTRLGVRQKSF